MRAKNAKGSPSLKLGPSTTIYGSARDSRTQQPVAFAEVRLMVSQMRGGFAGSAFTDAKGNFSIGGLSGGSYNVIGIRPGYSFGATTAAPAAGQKMQRALVATPEA